MTRLGWDVTVVTLSVSTRWRIFGTFCGYTGLFDCLVSLCGVQACAATLTITDFVVCAGFDFIFSNSLDRIGVVEFALKIHKHFVRSIELQN